MIFSNLRYAYFFCLVPILIIFLIWAYRSKHKALGDFAQSHLVPMLTSTVNWQNQKIKSAILVFAICFLVFALIGPKWGFQWHEVRREGIDIIVAIDTSKSMLTQDIKPNRLERSKLAIEELLDILKGDRIGLVAFSGGSFLQCPLTLDYGAFAIALDVIDTSIIPQGGTSIGSAIETATEAFTDKKKKHKAVILITDGEDHIGSPVKMAEEAAKHGIKIFCVGVGTKEGELIPVEDERGNIRFLKDRRGQVVKSSLNETALQKIALATSGGYVRASSTEFGLDIIYNEKINSMEKKELESTFQKRYEERYQIPLVIALAFLCLEGFLGERRRRLL